MSGVPKIRILHSMIQNACTNARDVIQPDACFICLKPILVISNQPHDGIWTIQDIQTVLGICEYAVTNKRRKRFTLVICKNSQNGKHPKGNFCIYLHALNKLFSTYCYHIFTSWEYFSSLILISCYLLVVLEW